MVDICCREEYLDTTCPPVAVRFFGSNGLEAESYPQLLELLGVAPADPEPSEAAAEEATACLPAQDKTLAGQNPQLPAPVHSTPTASETAIACSAESRLEKARNQALLNSQPIPRPEAIMPKQPEYESMEEQDDDQEDDSRPQPITAEDIARIDQMSPNELNTLIEDMDAHEEWEELRREAKQRIEFWEGGLKVAHQSPRCGHLKNKGKPCGSPAMKDDSFCYFHSQARVQRDYLAAASGLELPSLEDRCGVQLAIMRVCGMLVDKTLDEKTGRAVLVGLRLAQKNLGYADALFGPNDPD